MRTVDGELKFQASGFRDHVIRLDNLNAVVRMQQGLVDLEIDAGAEDGGLSTRIAWGQAGMLDLQFHAEKLPVPSLIPLSRNDLFRGGVVDAEIALKGAAPSLSGLVAGGDGHIRLDIRDARIFNSSLNMVGGDLLTNLITQINPFQESREHILLECGAIYLDVADGLASTRNGFALKTDRVTVLGGGEISFPEEKLDILLAPKARKGFGISASSIAKMIRLGGTLKAPQVETDTQGLLKSGVALGAAIMSGGVSLVALGVLDRLQANADVCAIARGEKQPGSAIPSSENTEIR
jgi:hypothetical protein